MFIYRIWLVVLFRVGCLVLGLIPLSVGAQEFKPLDQVIASENSDWNTFYVFQRCAAVHNAAAFRLDNSGRNDVAQLINENENSSKYWLNFVLLKAEQLKVSDEQESIAIRISQMMIAHLEIMDKNYTLTGSAFSGFFINDLNVCKELQAN